MGLTDCGPGEDEVHGAETKGSDQSHFGAGAGLDEDGAGVEGDDVDAAHLLGDHDCEGCQGCATYTGDREELDEPCDIVACSDDGRFLDQLCVDKVEISCSLQRRVTEST